MDTLTETPYTRRGRYLSLDQGFNVGRPDVPAAIFLSERDEALSGRGDSRLIVCDQQAVIGGDVPATTPLLQAAYLRLMPGQPLELKSGASAEIFYVIRGQGTTRWPDGSIDWREGDVMLLPGGLAQTHISGLEGAVLWRCTNEPQIAYENAVPVDPGHSPVQPTHYTRSEMLHALAEVKKLIMKNGMRSMAIMLATDASRNGTITPTLTLALNSIPRCDAQIPHRHNSVAVTLVLEGDQCYSMVDGEKVQWSQFATFVTPAGASHSHHNPIDAEALVLIVQDGGLYYHCRTMGFAVTEA